MNGTCQPFCKFDDEATLSPLRIRPLSSKLKDQLKKDYLSYL